MLQFPVGLLADRSLPWLLRSFCIVEVIFRVLGLHSFLEGAFLDPFCIVSVLARLRLHLPDLDAGGKCFFLRENPRLYLTLNHVDLHLCCFYHFFDPLMVELLVLQRHPQIILLLPLVHLCLGNHLHRLLAGRQGAIDRLEQLLNNRPPLH